VSLSALSGGSLLRGRVVVIDDDPNVCDVLCAALELRGLEVHAEGRPEAALEYLAQHEADVILTDHQMPGLTGVELCERLAASGGSIPVIIMTAHASMETAVAAMRAGAFDFVTKPVDLDDLALRLERTMRERALRLEVKRLRASVCACGPPEPILGDSPPMQELLDRIERVAEADASVLITGESGTGKELIARSIHRQSRRKDGPYVAINCAAVPDPLLESELFGHVRGAFTDAKQSRTGLFVQASGGTLLLDEIGEMPPGMQAKVLRALQERRVRPVGGDTEVLFDARILSTTSRDLEVEVKQHRFREDLYYRIAVMHLRVPPLRERSNDILLLAQHFLEPSAAQGGRSIAGMTQACAALLLSYRWRGNVRELQNCIEHASALAHYDKLGVEDLPERIREPKRSQVVIDSEHPDEMLPMAEVERRYLLHVLELTGGNKAATARIVGFDRRTLYRKLGERGVLGNGPGEPPE
jgi:DNA-binding NtrC family response regulator